MIRAGCPAMGDGRRLRAMRAVVGICVVGLLASCGPDGPKAGSTGGGSADANTDSQGDGAVQGADTAAADTAADTGNDCTGSIGCACASPTDCNVALCLETRDGRQCSSFCGDGFCPDGWACEGSSGGADATYFCVRKEGLVCRPCSADAECQAGGHKLARCVDYGDAGAFCGIACQADADCPSGRVCRDVTSIEGGTHALQCVVPAADGGKGLGPCDCSPAAAKAQLTTTCWQPDDEAASPRRCKGSRACTPSGLGPCALLQGDAARCVDEQCLDPKTKLPLAVGVPCSDGRACTKGDACDGGGTCVAGVQTCPCEPGILGCPAPTAADAANLCKGAPYCAAQLAGDGVIYTCEPNPALTKVCDASADGACSKNACLPSTGACTPTPIERTAEVCDLPAKPGSTQKSCRREVLAADLPDAKATPCDDGLACSVGDTCSEGSCQADTSACKCTADADCQDDGDTCNGLPYCDKSTSSWSCKVNPATIVSCDTSTDTGCAATACEPKTGACKKSALPAGSPCDDGVACTAGDICDAGGSCKAGSWVCCNSDADCASEEDGNACNGTLYCNKQQGGCVLNPATLVKCPTIDDTACRQNLCQPLSGKCALQPVAETKPCDDGSTCTVGETCAAGQCQGGTDVCACSKDADCAALEDGDPCNGTLYCDPVAGKDGKGACKVNPKTVVSCPSVNDTACLRNTCDKQKGACAMTPLPATTACDADGTACTSDDGCDGKGGCVAGKAVCPCLGDADCAAKEDGDACNGSLFCDKSGGDGSAQCKLNPATVVTCPSVNDTACLRNTCDPKAATCSMQPAAIATPCEDGDYCTSGDGCDGKGGCVAGKSVCGCKTAEDCKLFDDGSVCNGAYLCLSNLCQFDGKSLDCNDNNACTSDSCDKDKGCVHTPNSNPCDADGTACTENDACKNGTCSAGAAKNCNDGEPCTIDSCVTSSGSCQHKAIGDGSVCGFENVGRCASGACSLVAKSVAAGKIGSCAVLDDGRVACWGVNFLTGTGSSQHSSRPVVVPGLNSVVEVVVSSAFACARRSDKTAWCWGDNSVGQVGVNSTTPWIKTPTKLSSLSDVTALVVGDSHACAHTSNFYVQCWGGNGRGQTGVSVATTKVLAPTSVGYTGDELAAGGDVTCTNAKSQIGHVIYCWGDGKDGVLVTTKGYTNAAQLSISLMQSGTTTTRIGANFACTRSSNTSANLLSCWGTNDAGQFGPLAKPNSGVVYGAVLPSSSYTFAAGGKTACMVDSGGTVRCWGANVYGQLGNGSTNATSSYVIPPGLGTATHVSVGASHVCARSSDGAVRCWGNNEYGKLGRGGDTGLFNPPIPSPGRVLAPL